MPDKPSPKRTQSATLPLPPDKRAAPGADSLAQLEDVRQSLAATSLNDSKLTDLQQVEQRLLEGGERAELQEKPDCSVLIIEDDKCACS